MIKRPFEKRDKGLKGPQVARLTAREWGLLSGCICHNGPLAPALVAVAGPACGVVAWRALSTEQWTGMRPGSCRFPVT